MDVAGGGEGEVDGAEEEVGGRQADHEERRRVRAQLRAPQQRHHRQEVAYNRGGNNREFERKLWPHILAVLIYIIILRCIQCHLRHGKRQPFDSTSQPSLLSLKVG